MEGRTAGVARRHARLYVVVGLLLVAVYFLLGTDAQSVLYDLLGVAAVAGVVVGILRNRPAAPGAWWSIALGLALTVSGDIYWTAYELITRGDPPFPSFADVLYVAGYPVLAAGLIGLCIERRPARSDAIDAAIIGTGFTLVSWTYFLEPYLTDESYPWIERVVSASYPAMDIPLVIAAAMLLLTPRARSRSFFMFAVAIVATLLGDLVYTQKQLAGTYTGDEFVNAAWLVAYVAWGAAALSINERRPARAEPATDTHLSMPRLGLLAAAMVIGTTVWLLNHDDDSQTTLIIVSATNAFLVALVCIRLWDTFGAINQKERRFRTLVEHSSDIISVYDADGTMRYVSPAMTEVLDEEPSAWIDRDASALVHPDDRLRLGLIFARLKRRPGEQRTFELRLLHRDGSWRTVEVIGTNRLGDPAVRGIVGNARDITARAEAEEALRRAEALNHSVIESGADGLVAYDLNCNVTVWNPMMERTTGFLRAQVIGRSAFEVFPFLHETGEDRILRSALHGMGGIAPAQPNRMPETGQDGYYEAYYSPLRDLDGKITGGLCLVRNVTTRAQAEQALASHNRILALSASGATLDVVLTEMCLELEASMSGSRCSVMLIDQSSGRLFPAAGPSMPPGFVQVLRDAGGVLPGPAMGSCGTAVFRGATVISADIEHDPLWDGWVELALSNGLRAAWSVPIFDDGGVALGSFAVYHANRREPTERELELVTEAGHLAGMAIRARNAQRAVRFQADLLDQVSAAVVATDARGVITHWNRYATVLYGWDREDAIGRGIYEIIDRSLNQDEEDAAYDETFAMREVRDEPWAGEVLARRKNGSTISLQLSLSPITGDDGHPIGHVGVAVDLTERKVFEARLAHQAFHDALTGLPNRALFADRLDHALSV
ncbi:MAG: PAS domain S-box protein, partial [Thermomicrobiales bacterium]|nr:PAS domain S-box protein [Thermomicrobiales bacterium]